MSRADEPAYPNLGDGSRWDGMTIRERFVMAAMQGVIVREGPGDPSEWTAKRAIEIADATLAALEQADEN